MLLTQYKLKTTSHQANLICRYKESEAARMATEISLFIYYFYNILGNHDNNLRVAQEKESTQKYKSQYTKLERLVN